MKSKPRILIVDDHPLNRRVPAVLLKQHGWICARASSGRQALTKLAAAPFDAVLLDLSMPDISGYELCHRIRTDDALKHLRVIAYTSLSSNEDVIRAAGFDALLSKPFTHEKLLSLLAGTPPEARAS